MSQFEVKLESEAKIQQKIQKVFAARVARIDQQAILNVFKKAFEQRLEASRAWDSLQGGRLAADFGLPRGSESARLDAIKRVWLNSFTVSSKKRSRNRIATYEFFIKGVDNSYGDVTRLAGSNVRTDEGRNLDWLNWLLNLGDSEIINDYTVKYGSFPGSRSGRAIMVVSVGDGFRVDPTFSGRRGNNIISDIAKDIYRDRNIQRELRDIVVRALR